MPNNFSSKTITQIEGTFWLPSYQRGYRWGTEEVTRLLRDILTRKNLNANYCLQPIVVKQLKDDSYELIDGQQRLTTLYIILQVIKEWMPATECKYSISYVTRTQTADFLKNLTMNLKQAELDADKYIDFRYMFNAFNQARAWIKKQQDPQTTAIQLYLQLSTHVKVLWYEASPSEDGHELFKRLNIGRIPLTNAELVKALFLNRDAFDLQGKDAEQRQQEISTQWDRMERELHNEAFWNFLTNEKGDDYSTRMELIFNFMSGKKKDERDENFTFFYFSDCLTGENGKEKVGVQVLWNRIVDYYETLKQWFEGSSQYGIKLFNRIGFLVWTKTSIPTLLTELNKNNLPKDKTIAWLEKQIADKIRLPEGKILEEINYQEDAQLILRILTWFNVKTLDNSGEKFPFHRFKKGSSWSLEHIHAQNSETLTKEEQWHEWLRLHLKALEAIPDNLDSNNLNNLREEIVLRLKEERIGRDAFSKLAEKVTSVLSVSDYQNDANAGMHLLSNMALIKKDDNAVLSNSVFEVKRQKLAEMDRQGKYIPVCTRNVFTKYYTPAGQNQPYFWGPADRQAYLEVIKQTINL